MKTDLYTKVVLTTIALCLTIIVLKQVEIIPNAYANTSASNSFDKPNYGLVPLNSDGSINVRLTASDIIKVDLVKVDGWWVKNSSGKLKVEIEN